MVDIKLSNEEKYDLCMLKFSFLHIIYCPKYVDTFYAIYTIQTVAVSKTNYLVWTIIVLVGYRKVTIMNNIQN